MKRTPPVPEVFIDLLKQPEKEKNIIRPDLFSMQMRLSCSALPEKRPPMFRNFHIQLRSNIRIKVAEFRAGKAGGQIQLAKPPAGIILVPVGILFRNRQGKHGSIRQNRAGPPAGPRVKSLATQNKFHVNIFPFLRLPHMKTNPPDILFRNFFSSQAISRIPVIKIHRTIGSVKRGFLRRKDKNFTIEPRPAIDTIQAGMPPYNRIARNDRLNGAPPPRRIFP